WRLLIVEKRSRLRRLFGFLAFRLIPILLIIGILVTGYQVAQGLVQRLGEQDAAVRRQPFYAQTATAMATPAPSAGDSSIRLMRFTRNDAVRQFETNTPQPEQATLAPANTPTPPP